MNPNAMQAGQFATYSYRIASDTLFSTNHGKLFLAFCAFSDLHGIANRVGFL